MPHLTRAKDWLRWIKSVMPNQNKRSPWHVPLQHGSTPQPFVSREGQDSIAAFIAELHTLEAILERHEEEYWHSKIRETRLQAEASDAVCVRKFLGMCGGMGSLTDLLLPEAPDTQMKLNEALSRAYDLALQLQRGLNATPRA